MKNIHTLLTDKTSKLYVRNDVKTPFYSNFQGDAIIIYITSDEEIKEGDWWLNLKTNDVDKCTHKSEVLLYNSEKYEHIKKTILTTDQDLIDDNVQAINDEFLDWFVKNQSCEFVKTYWNPLNNEYDFIIPQEELKHTIVKETCIQCDGNGETTHPQTYNSQRVCNLCNGKGDWSKKTLKEELKQKTTLEEVAEINRVNTDYSEFEVKTMLIKLRHNIFIKGDVDLEKWFEQFKKK
jgi:ferritin